MRLMPIEPNLNIVRDGLIAWCDVLFQTSYPNSGTTWYDLGGNDDDGTLVNGVSYDSANGGSLDFDGTDDYVDFGNSLTNGQIDISVSLWCYVYNVAGTQWLMTKYDFVTLRNGWAIYYSGTTNKFSVDGRESAALYISNPSANTFSANNWYNIVYTKSANNWRLYINGVLEANNLVGNGTTPFSNSVILALAALPQNNDYGQCKIAQMAIYDRALSSTEVSHNYNTTKGRFI